MQYSIEQGVNCWQNGGCVIFPTETVYGLGADATSNTAVAQIYKIKQRPAHNPRIVHGYSADFLAKFAHFTPFAELLAKAFWPGPLALVVPHKQGICNTVRAGHNTIAIRVPNHPIALDLLELAHMPIAAPSANISGKISPTKIAHALSLGVPYIDGGDAVIGIESTIVDVSMPGKWALLRPGFITEEEIINVLGVPPIISKVVAPGQLQQHYAPDKPVLLNAEKQKDSFHIGFGNVASDYNLSEVADLSVAAARVFTALHKANESTYKIITVSKIPDLGIGLAINDRLRRAAAQ